MNLGGHTPHGTTLILLAAIVCGVSVYMALDIRKKLNLVDIVLTKINQAAEDAVTKADLEGFTWTKPAPDGDDNVTATTGKDTCSEEAKLLKTEEMVILSKPLPSAKRQKI